MSAALGLFDKADCDRGRPHCAWLACWLFEIEGRWRTLGRRPKNMLSISFK
jgi:hypothetical protein